MTDFPFKPADNGLSAALPRLPLVPSRPLERLPAISRKRRKLWELAHKCHCPVIGTCFEVSELRALMKKVMHFPHDTSDFVLHTTAVGACDSRSQLAELLHRQLEKRYPLTVKQFATARDTESLTQRWRAAVGCGNGIPAALWATLTHPDCDATLEHEIYGDIHMIQHQIGSGHRADLKALKSLREENAELRRQLDKAQGENESLRSEKSSETQALAQRIIELRAEQAGRDARIVALSEQLEQLRNSPPELKARQMLQRRADNAETRCQTLAARLACRERELLELRDRLQQAEESIGQLCRDDEQTPLADEDDAVVGEKLAGKCVLCVGGRAGAIDAYRQIVEQSGGRFIHHDGGLEESLHRIDNILTAADLVICQAGCISHNAYWRVKEQCKRTGKRCLFVRSSGVSSFGRALDDVLVSEE